MDVRWMSSSDALLASPEILQFRAEKNIAKNIDFSGWIVPYGTPPSQKHVHMCMFLRIAQILILIKVSNLATTAPGTGRRPEWGCHWLL